MTVTSKTLVEARYIPTSNTQLYIADGVTAIVYAAVIGNASAADATVTISTVPPGGAPDASNEIIEAKRVRPNEDYQLPGLQRQVFEPGASIWMVASHADALTVRISGVEIT